MNTTGGNWSRGSYAGGFSVGFNTLNSQQVSIGLRSIYVATDIDDGHYARQAFNKYFGLEFAGLVKEDWRGVSCLDPDVETEMGGEIV